MTLQNAQEQFDLNADYFETRDAVKARKFITACTLLLRYMPQFSEYGLGNERMGFNTQLIQDMKKEAQLWLAGEGRAYDTGAPPRVTYADISRFRKG